jgi:hypothetical protein
VHLNTTAHPTAEWAAQQVVDTFRDDSAPRWIHRDRDRICGATFRRRVAVPEAGILHHRYDRRAA